MYVDTTSYNAATMDVGVRELKQHLSQYLARVRAGELDRIAAMGFDWVWLLGVWQTGPASRAVSRTHEGLRGEFLRVLPDLREDDICGSCFAIAGYTVHAALGGDAALARLRQR